MSVFAPLMAKAQGASAEKEAKKLNALGFEGPAPVAIDNSPGMVMQIAQAALKGMATAVGGDVGGKVADGVTNSYNKSQEMPTVSTVPQLQMQTEDAPLSLASVYTEKDRNRKLPVTGGTPMNFIDRQKFPNFVGPMQPDFYNSNSQYYQGGLA